MSRKGSLISEGVESGPPVSGGRGDTMSGVSGGREEMGGFGKEPLIPDESVERGDDEGVTCKGDPFLDGERSRGDSSRPDGRESRDGEFMLAGIVCGGGGSSDGSLLSDERDGEGRVLFCSSVRE